MDRAIKEWLSELNRDFDHVSNLADRHKLSYTIYGCMLLLPPKSFESPAWQDVRSQCSLHQFETLYELIAKHLKVTHIAINKPIPALNGDRLSENTLRAPSNFTPLLGDFGPSSCSDPPTVEDYKAAFWVTAKQNGIFQTWAPRWTMFSRGNISEKARLLTLPSVREVVEQGRAGGKGSAAVDMYAGIGYFAFSYLRAGVDRVLCWDLNTWSIEGLRRGAAANRWSTATFDGNEGFLQQLGANEARILIFNESNERASDRVHLLQHRIPPIRHINCGLLPTSQGSWQTAVNILDREMGGWLHVHENFAVNEIEQKSEEVRIALEQMWDVDHHGSSVKIECINQLKSYAPGVMHCVIDICIPPHTPG